MVCKLKLSKKHIVKIPTFSRFVAFSSVTAGRGNVGQTAYGWVNSCMERIVEQRRHAGLCGMAIEWGAIGDVGVILDNLGNSFFSSMDSSPVHQTN